MRRPKIVKEIPSPEKRRFAETVDRTRTVQQEQLRDEIHREAALLAPDGTVPVTSSEAQDGRKMTRTQFVTKIRRLNPNLWYERSVNYPDIGGLYIADSRAPFGKRMVCGLPNDMVREFALRLTVPKVIPDPTIALHWRKVQAVDQQVPGWRTVLLKLIMDDFITPSGAEKEFQITRGRSSRIWQEAVS